MSAATLAVLFRDPRFAVIDKPAGLPVHAARGAQGDSVEARFASLGRFRNGPWLAHRLDRDTAGCLVVALKRAALHAAQACFAEGRADKIYWAVVRGRPDGEAGVVRDRLARVERGRAWRIEAREDGLAAETAWRVRGTAGAYSWLELAPRTGRTHQVRVHCASLGCPIVGDPIYGVADGALLHLLARSITLKLDPPLSATAPPPLHMRGLLDACGFES